MTQPNRELDIAEPRPDAARALVLLRRISFVMEDLFVVPGVGIRFGLDALVGLVPGLGDAVGGIVTFAGILLAAHGGAPTAVLARMLLNLGIDIAAGSVPLAGDAFDFAWKANRKNVALFERWIADPHRTHRASRWVLVGFGAAVLALMCSTVWLAWWILHEVWLALH